MSEISTSPEVATEAAPDISGGDSGGIATEVESTAAPETVQTTTAEVQEDSAEASGGEPQPEEKPTHVSLADFDPTIWEGNIDLLPLELQDPVRHLHKNLEGGYTKKFQGLSEDKKTFETDRDAWLKEKGTWEESKSELESELDLLRRIMAGSEDPRLGDLSTENETLKTNLQTVQDEFTSFKHLVDADIEEQAKEYADQFHRTHSDIFDDDGKREEFIQLLDKDWDPEVAVKLIGIGDEVVNLAAKLREKGAAQDLAVEHAMLKLGGSTGRKTPRPGAKLTAGAESKNNPASTRGELPSNNPREARENAARAALNWKREQDIRR